MLEVMTGGGAQLQQDFFEQWLGGLGIAGPGAQRWRQGIVFDLRQFHLPRRAPQFRQLLRHLGSRQHQVDHTGLDGGARHAVVLGVVRGLRQGHAALFLDPRQAHRTVGTGARQHHAEGVVLVHVGQVTEEQVDGHMVAASAVGRSDAQVAVVGGKTVGRRNHIDMVAFDRHRLGDLAHRHRRGFLDDPVGHALVVGRQVQHHHKSCTAIAGHLLEEGADGLQPSSRRTDTDHREIQVAWAQRGVLRRCGLLSHEDALCRP